jgi:hypothetical protein
MLADRMVIVVVHPLVLDRSAGPRLAGLGRSWRAECNFTVGRGGRGRVQVQRHARQRMAAAGAKPVVLCRRGPWRGGRISPCPLCARSKEYPRVVTVAHGQVVAIPAGYGNSRWQADSATDFPS